MDDDYKGLRKDVEATVTDARRYIANDSFWADKNGRRRVRYGVGHYHLNDGKGPDGTPVHIFLFLTTDPTDFAKQSEADGEMVIDGTFIQLRGSGF
jgi:hypothetical protein